MKTKQPLLTAFVVSAILSVLVLQSCSKKDDTPVKHTPGLSPTKVQRPLILFQCATWCGWCPIYGDIPMKQIVEQYPNAIGIALHQSDYLSSVYPITNTINSIFISNNGLPCFNVDNQGEGEELFASVIESEQAKVPVAAVGAYWTKTTKYNIQARVKFYTATTGTYYLGVYAVQNGIPAAAPNLQQSDDASILSNSGDTTKWAENEASYTTSKGATAYWFMAGSPFTDDYVITASADGVASDFGQQLNKTSFSANDSLTFNFSITPNSSWLTTNVNIVTILWQENNGAYTYVNGYQ